MKMHSIHSSMSCLLVSVLCFSYGCSEEPSDAGDSSIPKESAAAESMSCSDDGGYPEAALYLDQFSEDENHGALMRDGRNDPNMHNDIQQYPYFAVNKEDPSLSYLVAVRIDTLSKGTYSYVFYQPDLIDDNASGTSLSDSYELEQSFSALWHLEDTRSLQEEMEWITPENYQAEFSDDESTVLTKTERNDSYELRRFSDVEDWLEQCEEDQKVYSLSRYSGPSNVGRVNCANLRDVVMQDGVLTTVYTTGDTEPVSDTITKLSTAYQGSGYTDPYPNVEDWDNPDDYASDNKDYFDSEDEAWQYWCEYAEDSDC